MKKQPSSELGQRLHNLRLALGLKQKDMAREAGLNSGYLSELISGKRDNPGIDREEIHGAWKSLKFVNVKNKEGVRQDF